MKVALCIPVHSRPETRFMANLLEMVLLTNRERPDIVLKPNIASSSDIGSGRHYLVKQALAWDVDWLLWLDADHAFPPNALLRLLSHGVEAVGCNYRRRAAPHLFTAAKDQALVETTKESPALEQVDHIPMGLALVSAAAILKLEPRFPMFSFLPRDDGGSVGEDVFFCQRLRATGTPVHVDHRLSLDVGHISEQVVWV